MVLIGNIVLVVTLVAVVGVLITGVVGMIRGGEFNRRYGHKLMRARVILQGVAILVLALLFLIKR